MFTFEFDGKKSQINLEKHGINFVNAQQLWADPGLVGVQAKTTDESRSLVIWLNPREDLVSRYRVLW